MIATYKLDAEIPVNTKRMILALAPFIRPTERFVLRAFQ